MQNEWNSPVAVERRSSAARDAALDGCAQISQQEALFLKRNLQ